MFCRACGKEVDADAKFCHSCGCCQAMQPVISHVAAPMNCTSTDQILDASVGGKNIGKSYLFSIVSAIVCFLIRIIAQDTYYSWENLMENRKVVGLDEDIKPVLTAIPAIAGIILSLLIVSDKLRDSQKKMIAFIVNAVFIVLSVLFIWYDIPYDIIDF